MHGNAAATGERLYRELMNPTRQQRTVVVSGTQAQSLAMRAHATNSATSAFSRRAMRRMFFSVGSYFPVAQS